HNYRFACPHGTLMRRAEIHDDCLDGSSFACGVRGVAEHGLRSLAYGVALDLQRRLGWLQRWVDAYVTPTEFVRTVLGRAGIDPAKAHVIRHGVPSSASDRGWSATRSSYALYAGRLAPEKGLEVLAAAARLAPEVPIVLAGSGPLEAALQRN